MNHVILAGGRGTRFWPLSRDDRPKQLVRLWDDLSMLQATAERLRDAPCHDRLFVIAPRELRDQIDSHLPDLPDEHFITQPAPNGTLPAIGLAAAAVGATAPQTPMGLFPADHYIGDTEAFHRYLTGAEQYAQEGTIIALGIEPTRPETEYGYIKAETDGAGSVDEGSQTPVAFPVRQFEEKPDADTARAYLAGGSHLWNSGMFFARPQTLFAEFGRLLPEAHDALQRLSTEFRRAPTSPDLTPFFDIPNGSFDSQIVEHAQTVRVIPADMDWSDVGQWSSVDAIFGQDEAGNTIAAQTLLSDCQNCVVVSRTSDADARTIAAADLDGVVIVDTEDATLIVPRKRAERVRDLVDHLDDAGRRDLLTHR